MKRKRKKRVGFGSGSRGRLGPDEVRGSKPFPADDLSRKWSKWLWEDEETIRFESCVNKSWIIIMEFPAEPKPSPSEMVKIYIKTLASVVGSEEAAEKKIYSVRTTKYTGFGCLISEELSDKMKDLPGVRCVFPDPDLSSIEYL